MSDAKLNLIEETFVRTFISTDKQARYLEMLSSPKKRGNFLDRFNHQLDYDPAFAKKIPAKNKTPQAIELLLRKEGALNTCHVISSELDWDGRELPLSEALALVVGSAIGTVLCCNTNKLAYYESEDLGERYILIRGKN